MKRTVLAWTLAGLLALAACTQAPPDTTAADTAALQALSDQFLAAFNAGDAAAFESQYTDDAVLMPPDGSVVEGGAAIVQGMAEFFESYTASQTSTVDEISVFGDLAVARGTWNVRQAPAAGGAEEVRNGKWLTVSRRQVDGSWKVWRWMWNQEGAAAEPM